jgi:hypothetical protein
MKPIIAIPLGTSIIDNSNGMLVIPDRFYLVSEVYVERLIYYYYLFVT